MNSTFPPEKLQRMQDLENKIGGADRLTDAEVAEYLELVRLWTQVRNRTFPIKNEFSPHSERKISEWERAQSGKLEE